MGNGIIELLSWRCEGQIPGQAVLLTNLFLVWNSCGCNISIATCGAGDNRAWLSIAVVNLDALFHDAFCRALHTVWEFLMQGCQLQRLRAFYCVARCGQDCRISIGTRDSHAGAEKCADSKNSRVYARKSHICGCAHRCASGSGVWPSLIGTVRYLL